MLVTAAALVLLSFALICVTFVYLVAWSWAGTDRPAHVVLVAGVMLVVAVGSGIVGVRLGNPRRTHQ